jgi:hypothetical protein
MKLFKFLLKILRTSNIRYFYSSCRYQDNQIYRKKQIADKSFYHPDTTPNKISSEIC